MKLPRPRPSWKRLTADMAFSRGAGAEPRSLPASRARDESSGGAKCLTGELCAAGAPPPSVRLARPCGWCGGLLSAGGATVVVVDVVLFPPCCAVRSLLAGLVWVLPRFWFAWDSGLE